jgi:hypothetical protein
MDEDEVLQRAANSRCYKCAMKLCAIWLEQGAEVRLACGHYEPKLAL